MDRRPIVSSLRIRGYVAVEFQYAHVDFIANSHDFALVFDAFPRHIGDGSKPSTPPKSTNAP